MDRAGTTESIAPGAYPYFSFKLAPDGQRLALAMFESAGVEPRANRAEPDVYVYDLIRGSFDRLTYGWAITSERSDPPRVRSRGDAARGGDLAT